MATGRKLGTSRILAIAWSANREMFKNNYPEQVLADMDDFMAEKITSDIATA